MLTEKQKEILGFEYNSVPLTGQLKGDIVDPELVAIYKPSDKKILGVMPSGQYLISHLEAHNRVETAIAKAGLEAKVTRHQVLRNGARVFTHYQLPTYKMDFENPQFDNADPKEPDTLIPEIIARNGYDGLLTFGLEWGLFRTVCSNGARVTVIGQRNTPKNLMGDVDVDVLVGQISEFVGLIQKDIYARIQEMIQNKSENLPAATRAWLSNLVSERMLGLYDVQVQQLTAQHKIMSEWTLFNILTNVITHNVTSYNRQRALEQTVAKRFQFGAYTK